MHRSTLLTAAMAAALLLAPALASSGAPSGGGAAESTLTLDRALALARERAPAILSARARVDEARGRLAGASALLRDNPVVEVAAGPRRPGHNSVVDGDVAVSQTFELGSQRRARIQGAEAGVDRALSGSDEATRRLLWEVAASFLRALHAAEGVRLAAEGETVTADIVRIAERRSQAGEVSALDLNVARVALARARSESRAAEGARRAALGALQLILGLSAAQPLIVSGELKDRRRFELGELLARSPDRPDLRALEAEIQEAEAERRLGGGRRWPDLGLGIRYERDDGDNVLLGGLSLTIPIFERGQGQQAEAGARAQRLQIELDASRRRVGAEVRIAFEVYQNRVEAVEALEREALPLLDDNLSLARRGYDAGQIGLAELLLLRRETLETRALYLDRLLEAAMSGVELEASARVME